MIYGGLYAAAITVAFYFLKRYQGVDISLPWQPISVLGIAVAFYLGFKNNSSYDRTWEARKIWGSIVNNSRSFGAAVCTFVQGAGAEEIKRDLLYRHIAWLTALRHQLRLAREWEHTEDRLRERYLATVCSAYTSRLEEELSTYLRAEEITSYEGKANMATQLLRRQSEELQALRDRNFFEDFRHMEFHHLITAFYEDQGKSERIKNFPFPRQYASVALWQSFIFAALIPFGMLGVFSGLESGRFWLTIPFSALVIWVFFLMEKIGDYSENPFEGSYNDVPITAISRGIEIDLREMIQDANIPPPIASENGFLM